MEQLIRDNIERPETLEEIYHRDKSAFEKAFRKLYPELSVHRIMDFWKARLDYETVSGGGLLSVSRSDLFYLILTCLVAAVLIKIPELFGFDGEATMFYARNVFLIVFAGLAAFRYLAEGLVGRKHLVLTLAVYVVLTVYVNLLPATDNHTVILVYIHLPLLLWCIYGLIYINYDLGDISRRFDYIRHNGDLAILGALIAIAGGILTGITLGLFSAIGLEIEDFYFEYIVISGMVSAPIVATFITRSFPSLTNRIAVILANIFSPLVLITLFIYLVSIPIAGKDLYGDREFLLVFNLMLLGVMAVLVFSISEAVSNRYRRYHGIMMLLLVIVALVVDLIALSAILYRLGEFGFSPNRTAVLGSNLLIFGNLVLILVDLYKVNFKGAKMDTIERTVARYLPVYMLWTIIVIFVFPLIFGLN